MRKLSFSIYFVLLCIFVAVQSAYALPEPTKAFYVNDYADILSPETEEYIVAKAKTLNAVDGTQIVVVTVPSLENNALEEYSLEIFRSFGIGDKEKNNGLLLFLALEDRKFRVDVGYGLEGILPDGKVGGLQDEFMIPYFRANEWDKGIKNGYDAFYKEIVEGNQLGITYANPTVPPADLVPAKGAEQGSEQGADASDESYEDFATLIVIWVFLGGIAGLVFLAKLWGAVKEFKKARGDERKGLKRKIIRYSIFMIVLGGPVACIIAPFALLFAVIMCPAYLGGRFGQYMRLKAAYKKYALNARPLNAYSPNERDELGRLKSRLGDNLDIEALDDYRGKNYSKTTWFFLILFTILGGPIALFVLPVTFLVSYLSVLAKDPTPSADDDDRRYGRSSWGDSYSSDDSDSGGGGSAGGGGASRDF